MSTREEDIRVEILNALLTTPHRELQKIWPVHQDLIAKDPRFYVRLAAWYADHGDVRDHKEMFIICLVLSDFAGHRDVGLAMLRALPPYQVVRVVDFISGRKKTRPARRDEKQRALAQASKRARRTLAQRVFGSAPDAEMEAVVETDKVTDEFGLFRNIPRAMKTEVTRYLREREADPEWFDGSVLSARKAMKRLYALLHVRPDERAQKILFEDDPPVDSRLYALRELAAAESPAEQAKAIVQHKIPYRVASTVIRQMTPTVLVALIEQMSAQELINSLGALKRRGALDVPEIRSLVEAKLADAKTADRVSALKAEKAIEAVGVSDQMRQALENVADTQIKAKGRIARPTALLVDKSASMYLAIDLGKRIGAMISAICESELYTYAFDTMAYEITSKRTDLADWERAFKGISAGGATSCGVALKNLERKKQFVEQVIIITDEEQNTPPTFISALREYSQALQAAPSVVIVRTPGGSSYVERSCRDAGIQVDVFNFEGDYYSLPNLVPMLSRPSKMELMMEIMDYPLPERKSA
ncbi:MAG: hypothetical protein DWQ31_08795 [Planctomycetota bacterium]|nr:MAG: hypothetical protein DWQ31_08795 [Planctomycetota bacterium]REJ86913.1 MAG: hypothetical protein DWQ35_22375 [Planctomycetota bacterium]REK26604.1 MAG: hypothetical protein DWQ42_08455 [Planctomycetota bacterium]